MPCQPSDEHVSNLASSTCCGSECYHYQQRSRQDFIQRIPLSVSAGNTGAAA